MSAATLVFRRAEPDDYAGIAATFDGASVTGNTLQTPYPSLARWREILSVPSPRNHMLVGVIDGRIVAHGGLMGNDAPRRAHCYGLGMSVDEAWQGQRIGSRLLDALLELADDWLGALRVELTVYTDNARAIALYQGRGFVVEGTHRGWALRRGEYVDALAMARWHPRPPRVMAD